MSKRPILLLAFAASLHAQCLLNFTLTTEGRSPVYDNRGEHCASWSLTFSQGGRPATVTLQSAESPTGPWTTFSGTSPSTSGIGVISAIGSPSYVSVIKSPAGSGTLVGTLLGMATQPSGNITINGVTGTSFTLNSGNIPEGSNLYYTPARVQALINSSLQSWSAVQTTGSYSDPAWLSISKAKVGLSAVENTALSTWTGSANITTLGTISSGSVPWARLTSVPSSFSPALHASEHGSGKPDAVTIAESQVTGLVSDLASKAATASPVFSGNVGVGTSGPTARLEVANAGVSPADTPVFLAHQAKNNGGSSVAFEFVDDRGYGGAVTGAAFRVRSWTYGTDTSALADFSTISGGNSVSRLYIANSSGYIGIGKTDPGYFLQLASDSAAKPTTSTWTVTSDMRVKTNVRPFTDGLDVVRQLRPVTYELNGKAGLPLNSTGIGLIAQEAQPIVPYMIGTYKAKLNPDDAENSDILNLNASAMPWLLVNALKDLERQTFLPVYAEDVEPACAEKTRGNTRFVKDDLLGDQVRQCGRGADGSFVWKLITQY